MKLIIQSVAVILTAVALGTALKCFECNSATDKNCGSKLNIETFKLQECNGTSVKCGTQIQEPDSDGWVGVMRACYSLGRLPGINETNGCHLWTNPDNYTARYCFCAADGCNKDVSEIITAM